MCIIPRDLMRVAKNRHSRRTRRQAGLSTGDTRDRSDEEGCEENDDNDRERRHFASQKRKPVKQLSLGTGVVVYTSLGPHKRQSNLVRPHRWAQQADRLCFPKTNHNGMTLNYILDIISGGRHEFRLRRVGRFLELDLTWI